VRKHEWGGVAPALLLTFQLFSADTTQRQTQKDKSKAKTKATIIAHRYPCYNNDNGDNDGNDKSNCADRGNSNGRADNTHDNNVASTPPSPTTTTQRIAPHRTLHCTALFEYSARVRMTSGSTTQHNTTQHNTTQHHCDRDGPQAQATRPTQKCQSGGLQVSVASHRIGAVRGG